MPSGSPLPCSYSARDMFFGEALLEKTKDKSVYGRKLTGSFGSRQGAEGQRSPSLSASSVKWHGAVY